jgi:hypothetical protein
MGQEKGAEVWRDREGVTRSRDTASYGGAGESIATTVDKSQREAKDRLAAAAARAQKKTPMPKQQEGESPAAYSDRLRRWRAGAE